MGKGGEKENEKQESVGVEVERRKRRYITIAVMMAKRIHLFPFRTQKLSSFTPKVLVDNYWEDR